MSDSADSFRVGNVEHAEFEGWLRVRLMENKVVIAEACFLAEEGIWLSHSRHSELRVEVRPVERAFTEAIAADQAALERDICHDAGELEDGGAP